MLFFVVSQNRLIVELSKDKYRRNGELMDVVLYPG
jgi:hypothetical protein